MMREDLSAGPPPRPGTGCPPPPMAGGEFDPAGLEHPFPFDPTYGYALDDLLAVKPPPSPPDYDAYWRARYQTAVASSPFPERSRGDYVLDGWRIHDLWFQSTDRVRIGGWLLTPESGPVRRGFVVGHGYGGRDVPDLHLPFDESAVLFPCCRGLGRSAHPPISNQPEWHVLHHIQDRDRYVLGGCVEDIWLAVTALLDLYPELAGRVGYLGISFGGGIGAMAAAWDPRIRRAHFCVPSFGNQPLRIRLPSEGSAASVQALHAEQPELVSDTLRYFDAAMAAGRLTIPVHCACARFDPAVAPPGQFAVYNAVPGEKYLFVLGAGHFPYPRERGEQARLLADLDRFFAPL